MTLYAVHLSKAAMQGFLSTHWSILLEVIKTPAMEREDCFLGYSTISCIRKKYGDTYLWPSMTVGRNTGRQWPLW